MLRATLSMAFVMEQNSEDLTNHRLIITKEQREAYSTVTSIHVALSLSQAAHGKHLAPELSFQR